MPMTPEELLAEHTTAIARLADRVRRVVVDAMPESEERTYPGWHGIGYVHPDAGYVCGIFPRRDEVRLGFEHGALLADPDGLLIEGNQVRYMVFHKGDTIDAAAISDLIADAVELRSGK